MCATVPCCAKWACLAGQWWGLSCSCTGPLREEGTLIALCPGRRWAHWLLFIPQWCEVHYENNLFYSTALLVPVNQSKVRTLGQWPKMGTKRKLSLGLKWLKCQSKSPVLLTPLWLIHSTQEVFLALQDSQPFFPGSLAVPEKQLPLWAKTFPGSMLGHLQTCPSLYLIDTEILQHFWKQDVFTKTLSDNQTNQRAT